MSPPSSAWPSSATPAGDRPRHRIDAADRRDAERDAGEEDEEARQPAAHLAQREAKASLNACKRREDAADPRAFDGGRTAARPAYAVTSTDMQAVSASAGASRSGPSASTPAASSGRQATGSWVTRTSVMPRSACLGEQQVGDLPPGRLVEIAGRLVGDQDAAAPAPAPGRSPRAAARRRKARRDSASAGRARPTAASSRAADAERIGHGRQAPAARRRSPAPSCWG